MSSAPRFAFTKIFVDDVDKEAAFYIAALGMNQKTRIELGEGDGALEEVILTSGEGDGSSFILWRYLFRTTPPPGEATMGFDVDDAEDTVRKVQANGGSIVEPIRTITEAGVAVAFVADPEGHVLEIVQNLR